MIQGALRRKRILIAVVLGLSALTLTACGGETGGKTPQTTTKASTKTQATSTSAAATTASIRPTLIRIDVRDGKPEGGIKQVKTKRGDEVDLVVHSDVADEVHLHGYDKHVDVDAGATVHLRFKASIAGVFEAELERRKLQILELTVT